MNNYYKAYEERYSEIHKSGILWEDTTPTKEVLDTILKYKISKNNKILELGCGEGRDAIYLLNKGYNLLALDYSKSAILKCNQLTNNKYKNSFRQLDLIEDDLNEQYDFIYSIAVIHMFVNDEHRKKFFDFIYNHLKFNGKALIMAMGDGENEYSSDPGKAFEKVERVNINSNKKVQVVGTSCCIKSLKNMLKEIKNSGLTVLEYKIVDDLVSFTKCELFIIQKDK